MNVPGTLVAALVVTLFVVALAAMTVRNFLLAGFCFLSASLLIYLREQYLVE